MISRCLLILVLIALATPAVAETGLPPKVLKKIRRPTTSAISGRVTQAPSGAPLPSPLAMVTMSGVTPQFSKPQKCVPVRPKPVCTSSAISSTSYRRVNWRTPRK